MNACRLTVFFLALSTSLLVSDANSRQLFGIGTAYAPAHYPAADARNDEDESNVYPEMRQLQEAGYTTVRDYGDPGKTWIAIINAANQLGMTVVYQVALDISGQYQTDQFEQVVNLVSPNVFNKVVKLVLVGNENVVDPNINQNAQNIADAITTVKTFMNTNGMAIPVSTAIQADIWCGYPVSNKAALDIILGAVDCMCFNVYPFQWGVDVNDSVTNAAMPHSIAWYIATFSTTFPKFFPADSTPNIVITETGWATQGTDGRYASQIPGTLADAGTYAQAVYSYVAANKIPLLYFMAYDQPTKNGVPVGVQPLAEQNYGVFDMYGNLKGSASSPAINLLPNQSYNSTYNGVVQNSALFTFGGSAYVTNQAPFTIKYNLSSSPVVNTVSVPTEDRTDIAYTPWPTITLDVGSSVTLLFNNGTSSTNTVESINANNSGGTWTTPGPDSAGTNWSAGQTVYIPWIQASSMTDTLKSLQLNLTQKTVPGSAESRSRTNADSDSLILKGQFPGLLLDPTINGISIELEGSVFNLAAENFVTLPDGFLYKDDSNADGIFEFKIKNTRDGKQDCLLKLSNVNIEGVLLQDGLQLNMHFGNDQQIMYSLDRFDLKQSWRFDSAHDYQETLDLFDNTFAFLNVEEMNGSYQERNDKSSFNTVLTTVFQFTDGTQINWAELPMTLIVDQAVYEIPQGDLKPGRNKIVRYKNNALGIQELVIKNLGPGTYQLNANLVKKIADFTPPGDTLLFFLSFGEIGGGAFIYTEQKINLSYK